MPNAESGGTYPKDQTSVETAKDRRRQKSPCSKSLTEYLLRISKDIEAADREKRLDVFRKAIRSHQYFDGNFYGYVTDNCEWRSYESGGGGEKHYTDNQIYPYVRTAQMEMSRRNVQIAVNPATRSDVMIRAARLAQDRVNANRDRTFTAHLKNTESLYCLLNGIAFRYTYMEQIGGRGDRKPKVVRVSASAIDRGGNAADDAALENVRLCVNCSRTVPEGLDKCTACGSTLIEDAKNTGDSAEIVIGYEEVKRSQNQWVSPNPISVIVSMRASSIEETPFIKWKQLYLRSELEHKFPDIELPSTDTSIEMRYISDQKLSTPAADNYSPWSNDGDIGNANDVDPSDAFELLELHQHWIDYAVYCDKRFSEPVTLANGKTIPAGVKLGEVFTRGLYFATVGDAVVHMWDEDRRDKWTSSPYSMRPDSMYGHGVSVAHQAQETINDLEALKMANAWANAVAREFVDPSVIPELSADPAEVTIVNNTDNRQIIGGAYAVSPPLPLSAEIYALSEAKKSSIQNIIGAMSGTGAGGLADSQKWGDTATAISIKRDLAVGRFAPDLELLADNLDRKQAIQFVKNERNAFTPEQWESVKGDYGDDALKAFLECDIDTDLIFTVVPNSYMPKTDAQEISRLTTFAGVAQSLMPLGPEVMNHAFEKFGLPERLGGWDVNRGRADDIIKRFETLADDMIAQLGSDAPTNALDDPKVASAAQLINDYADAPVDTFLDDHEGMQEAYRDWRNTDRGRNASNLLVAAVAFRVLLHREALVKQKQMLATEQILAQQPAQAYAQEQQMQAAQQQQMMAAADAEAGNEAATRQEDLAILNRVSELEDNREQRQHEQNLEQIRANAAMVGKDTRNV